MARLSVSIDDVAYMRGSDEKGSPSIYHTAMQIEMAGADGITLSLQRERSALSRKELQIIKNIIRTHFNLIIPPTDHMIDTAFNIAPGTVTLIGEGGKDSRIMPILDMEMEHDRIAEIVTELQNRNIMASLYIPPEVRAVKLAAKTKADYVEFSTWGYVNADSGAEKNAEIEKLISMAQLADKLLLGVSCGGGLDGRNITALSNIGHIEEFIIGRGIIGKALFIGLDNAVKEIIQIIRG